VTPAELERERDWYRTRWALERGLTTAQAQRMYERDRAWRLSMEAEVNRAQAAERREHLRR
jgi:hypothetical protein